MVASETKLFPSWSSDKSIDISSDLDDARGKGCACHYAKKRQWGRLRDFLLRVKSTQLNFEDVDAEGQTLLHIVCSHQPPIDIVKSVINMFPAMTDAIDAAQRTPLHEAVACSASMEVVKFLVNSNQKCTAFKDADGKTPLMFVCEEIGQIDEKWELGDADELEAERRLLYLCDLAEVLVVRSATTSKNVKRNSVASRSA
eukprot:CAMPEP_0197436488 /NCGR_PEP_ID=MMETSP1175-20131217/3925_1 /TAXON_ID=1003142 /ORGANISM="Triceratium dubium, Strain CCMP147" /LENGTH=199 /DNA_ID=CAMNT_0042965789 /DNA_START=157 /DNA_END=756 /DNA_ORIENTATION=+